MAYSFRMTPIRFLYGAQYHRQQCTLHAFEQFRAMYMQTLTTNIWPGQDSAIGHGNPSKIVYPRRIMQVEIILIIKGSSEWETTWEICGG